MRYAWHITWWHVIMLWYIIVIKRLHFFSAPPPCSTVPHIPHTQCHPPLNEVIWDTTISLALLGHHHRKCEARAVKLCSRRASNPWPLSPHSTVGGVFQHALTILMSFRWICETMASHKMILRWDKWRTIWACYVFSSHIWWIQYIGKLCFKKFSCSTNSKPFIAYFQKVRHHCAACYACIS